MDTDIRKTNKIPGCEQLTRPEEIAALSKYLGEIKRIQEEHMKLVDEGLEVPGRTTGRIPEVSELGDAVLSLEDTREKTLENTRLGITGDKRTVELGIEKERLTDTKETGLSQKKERLEDSRETRLETKSEVLEDQRQITLGDKKEELRDNRNTNLSEKTEHISIDPKIDRLETKSEVLEDQRQIGLETKVVGGEKNEQPTLSRYTDSLDVQQENTLGDHKENLQNTKEDPSLTDYVIGLVNEDRVSGLSDSVTPLNNLEEVESLGDHKETIEPGKDLENFGTTRDNTTLNPEDVNLETNRSDWLRGVIQAANARRDEDGLYNTAIRLFSEEGTEWSERVAALMSTYLSSSRISPERAEEFEELLASSFVYPDSTPQQLRPENQTTRDGGNYVDPDEIKDNPFVLRPNLYRREDNNNGDGPTRDHETWDYDENGNYVLTTEEDDARNNPPSFGLYRKNGLIQTPLYDLNIGPADAPAIEKWKNIGIKALNNGGVSSYLRYAAEQAVGAGDWTRGSLRTQLINEALALLVRSRDQLEKVERINKDRLPGDDNAFVSGLAEAASGGVGSALGQSGYTGYDPKAGVQSLIKTRVNVGKNIAGKVIDYVSEKKSIPDYGSPVPSEPFNRPKVVGKEGNKILTETTKYGYGTNTRDFRSNELGSGFLITLKDLCGKDQSAGAIKTGSLEELQKILTESDLITTANKVNKGIQRTLDSNMYWEVVLKPWVYNLGDKHSNGGYSFLPSIKEINTINRVEHGVKTTYNKWIPISNFELQKSKLTTKSLGLFDGEINYPVTSEYTNEFRMTVVDDQWKSWKHYFQKCSDVSVYNSEPHPINYYEETNPTPTAVDKSTLCAAFYKNIAFSIEIYVMTPQMSTIRKFHILAILRDFSEEYTGESDSGGSDLNVSFSIVGEVDEDEVEQDKQKREKEKADYEKAQRTRAEENVDRIEKELFGEEEEEKVIGYDYYSKRNY